MEGEDRIRVRWEGAFFNRHSLAQVNRELCLRLIAGRRVELSLLPVYEGQPDYLELLAQLRDLGFHPTWFEQFPTHEDLKLIEIDCLLRRD